MSGHDRRSPDDRAGSVRDTAVLVIDDEEAALQEMLGWFRGQGWRAFGARGAGEASTLVMREPAIRVVYCDVALPGTTGPEWILEQGRQGHPSGPLVFILFTGLGPGYLDVFQGLPNVVAVLRKPICESELAASLLLALRSVTRREPGSRSG